MSTINRVRVARLNPAIVWDYDREDERRREPGHRYGAPATVVLDPYTRRSNICAECHTVRATGTRLCPCDDEPGYV